ncbi:MAG TPA: hypothetical protein VHQ47_17325 [Phycisphaerae bacterium]|nr:hypothetical protein [Phycisphaerae bacterium]
MKTRVLVLGVIGFVALPSCMNVADRMTDARTKQHQAQLEANGTVARGACDDLGQYIAGNLGDSRLTLDAAPMTVASR